MEMPTVHAGDDVVNAVGRHIDDNIRIFVGRACYASLEGTVTYSGRAEGYGNVVCILSNVGGYSVETRYAHCSALLVSTGNQVSSVGTIIAKAVQTGWTTGSHLHFEIRINGEPINPRRFKRLAAEQWYRLQSFAGFDKKYISK